MSGALGAALSDAEARGRTAAERQLPLIEGRVRRRVRSTRRRRLTAGAAVALAFVVAALVTRPVDPPMGAASSPAPGPTALVVTAGALLDGVLTRRADRPAVLGQEAVACTDRAGGGEAQVCDAVWVGEGPLIDVSGSTIAVGADGSARVSWELRNAARGALHVDLSSLVIVIVSDSAAPQAPVPVDLGDAGATVAAGGTGWAGPASRYALANRVGLPVVLGRGAFVSGTAELPAGAVDPSWAPQVLLQVAMAPPPADGSVLALEATTPAITGAAATERMLADATPRTVGESGQGLPALRCDPATGENDRLGDRWGDGYLWAPTCTPLWLTAPSFTDVSVRSDLDRSPYTRVVRWSARNASTTPIAVDLAASSVVLELDPATPPHPSRLWATSGDGFARIDTLWRADDARTAAIRGPGSEVVLVQPGETVAGSATLHLPDGEEAQIWGSRLEHSRATVHLVLRAAGIGDDVMVLELMQP